MMTRARTFQLFNPSAKGGERNGVGEADTPLRHERVMSYVERLRSRVIRHQRQRRLRQLPEQKCSLSLRRIRCLWLSRSRLKPAVKRCAMKPVGH